jgi:ketosteroid isomerase-like protein
MRRIAPVVVCLLVAAPLATAQEQALPDKDLHAKVLAAWSTLDPENPARFYDKATPFPFYDVAPLKYDTFAAYMAGFKEMAATLTSLTLAMNPDLVVRPAGEGWAVSTATVKATMVHKPGGEMAIDCRWTVIWQKQAAGWVIVHDHFSAPYPME